MKLISKILEQTDYDRYLFLTFENDEIVGLNFHQGIGDPLDYYFATPCPHLTEIYRRLTYQNDKYKNKKGIIHTNSFELAKWIEGAIKDPRLIFHDSSNKDEMLKLHKESPEPTVIHPL